MALLESPNNIHFKNSTSIIHDNPQTPTNCIWSWFTGLTRAAFEIIFYRAFKSGLNVIWGDLMGAGAEYRVCDRVKGKREMSCDSENAAVTGCRFTNRG